MKKLLSLYIVLLIFPGVPALASADLNEAISFSSYVDEPLYIDLAVLDHSGWIYYNFYVEPYSCSYADFWVDTYFASYSACVYGEFSDDFYGCIEGDLGDGYVHIDIDTSGAPYLSGPPRQTCDVYTFENPYGTGEVYVIDDEDPYLYAGGGCFIGTSGHQQD